MNRGGNEPSTESACGGMYSKDVQDLCEDQMCNVTCLGDNNESETPKKDNARRTVRVTKISEEKKKIRFKEDKTLVEDQPRKKQTRPEEQRESIDEDVEAPVWWQLGVEGHSCNRRNRNRVRRYLRRTLDHLDAREDIPESAKHKERQRRSIQLESLQRPRRRDKCTEIWKGWWKKRRVKPMTIRSRAYNKNWWEGRNVPDCRKGWIMPSFLVTRKKLVHHIARGRRYGVVSDGNKYKGLHLQGPENPRIEARRQERRQ